MFFTTNNREDLENLIELASLQDQVTAVRLQAKLGKQNCHEDMKKLFEPVTKRIKDVSEDVTEAMMVTSEENISSVVEFKQKDSRNNE